MPWSSSVRRNSSSRRRFPCGTTTMRALVALRVGRDVAPPVREVVAQDLRAVRLQRREVRPARGELVVHGSR
jgi:hypothetical protein